jgi:hypothetical protein
VLIIERRQTSNGACSQGLALGGLQHFDEGESKKEDVNSMRAPPPVTEVSGLPGKCVACRMSHVACRIKGKPSDARRLSIKKQDVMQGTWTYGRPYAMNSVPSGVAAP